MGGGGGSSMSNSKKISLDFHDDVERLENARMRDPRLRYHEEKRETWCHDSQLNPDCKCEGCMSGVDPCIHGCHLTCIESCRYYPDKGLETFEGVIAYAGTEDYERLIEDWRQFCKRVLAERRKKKLITKG
jgi:hypothetical protein